MYVASCNCLSIHTIMHVVCSLEPAIDRLSTPHMKILARALIFAHDQAWFEDEGIVRIFSCKTQSLATNMQLKLTMEMVHATETCLATMASVIMRLLCKLLGNYDCLDSVLYLIIEKIMTLLEMMTIHVTPCIVMQSICKKITNKLY